MSSSLKKEEVALVVVACGRVVPLTYARAPADCVESAGICSGVTSGPRRGRCEAEYVNT